jgi:hypothetical protein
MHLLATLSEQERRRVVEDFVDETFGGLDANPAAVAMLRDATPDLPADPTAEQVEAWVELAELVRDPDFRASVRRMAEYQAGQRATNEAAESVLHGELVRRIRETVDAALAAGVAPDGDEAVPIVRDLVAAYAEAFGRTADRETAEWILQRLEVGNDRRVERYWQLLATIKGWPAPPGLAPTFEWLAVALRRHGPRAGGPG